MEIEYWMLIWLRHVDDTRMILPKMFVLCKVRLKNKTAKSGTTMTEQNQQWWNNNFAWNGGRV